MKEVRLNLTDNEKIAQNVLGLNSDYSTFNMKEKYINAGFDDYLSKPIDKRELNNILQKFMV